MIDAIKAFQQTKHFAEINEIKDQIEKGINKAIERGEYTCRVDINAGTPQYVRDEIVAWLQGLMYRVTMPKYEDQHGCPADQMTYYNGVDISWESERMILEKEKKKR